MANNQPKKITLPVDFWTCGIADHRHRNIAYAEACISRRRPGKTSSMTEAQGESVVAMRKSGETFSAIAEKFGVSYEVARSCFYRREHAARMKGIAPEQLRHDPFLGLKSLTSNKLISNGLRDRGDVVRAINDGRLEKMIFIGKTAIKEIQGWLGSTK